MTGRIAEAFAAARAEHRAALIGYLTAWDPDRAGSLARLVAACEAGLDVVELGVPFSDPIADGAEIQGAMVRALRAGATTVGVLELARELRACVRQPIVLFSYANPLLRRGEGFAREAKAAGIDGLLVVDLPPEHAGALREPARAAGLDWVGLVAPTTPPERMKAIVAASTGFVYAVTLRGVTGAALDAERTELHEQLGAIRAAGAPRVAAGFGVRTSEQARALARVADGVVVGSALVAAAKHGAGPLRERVTELRAALVDADRSTSA
jgi:tryptophan synthase alpha chain